VLDPCAVQHKGVTYDQCEPGKTEALIGIITVQHNPEELFTFHMKTIAVVVAYIVLVLSSLWCSVYVGTLAGTLLRLHKHKFELRNRDDLMMVWALDADVWGLPFVLIILVVACCFLGCNDYPWFEPLLLISALLVPVFLVISLRGKINLTEI
jgi:hypothetical protein